VENQVQLLPLGRKFRGLLSVRSRLGVHRCRMLHRWNYVDGDETSVYNYVWKSAISICVCVYVCFYTLVDRKFQSDSPDGISSKPAYIRRVTRGRAFGTKLDGAAGLCRRLFIYLFIYSCIFLFSVGLPTQLRWSVYTITGPFCTNRETRNIASCKFLVPVRPG